MVLPFAQEGSVSRPVAGSPPGWRAAAALLCVLATAVPGAAAAQGLFDMLRGGATSSFAPVDDGSGARPDPLSIIPVAPATPSARPAASPAPAVTAVPVVDEPEKGPRQVRVALPPSRPAEVGQARETSRSEPPAAEQRETATGPAEPDPAAESQTGSGLFAFLARNAAGVPSDPETDAHDVIPLEDRSQSVAVVAIPQPERKSLRDILTSRRGQPGRDEPPPGVSVPGLFATTPERGTRLAALPRTQGSFSPGPTRDDLSVRPPGLRDSEHAVLGMPGVYADEDAEFDCLPAGIKQVLVDVAGRFGHVAILNARRSRGTGARDSYHYRCRAVDFRVRGVALASVMQYLRQHPNVGGRKLYPFGFFHVDDGPIRSW